MDKPVGAERLAVLTIDLQNDFLHPEGAYGRAAQTAEKMTELPSRVASVIEAVRARGGVYISAQFTLVPFPSGEPIISPHLKKLRPFLGRGDFCPGEFGHDLVNELKPADFTIEKGAYSAVYQTRLGFLLKALGVAHLIVGGITTNGGVASTLRDAHLRDIPTTLLSDGTAAFSSDLHEATLTSLGSVTDIRSCTEMLEVLGGPL